MRVSRIFFVAVLDYGLIEERRPLPASTRTEVSVQRRPGHLLESFPQQRAVGQCLGSYIYLLHLLLGLSSLALSALPIALNIGACSRKILWFWQAIKFEDQDEGSEYTMEEESEGSTQQNCAADEIPHSLFQSATDTGLAQVSTSNFAATLYGIRQSCSKPWAT